MRRLILVLLAPLLLPTQVLAATLTPSATSAHYGVDQVFFGTGSSGSGLGANYAQYETSLNYEAAASVGDLGISNSASGSYQMYAGFNTTAAPYIQLVVTGSNLNLGLLSSSSTATANGTFFIRAWLAHGYVVQTIGNPPNDGSHTLATPSPGTSALSAVGTEQFGMNLMANTLPISFGTAINNVFGYSHGTIISPYGTMNHYAYNNTDNIAQSTQSSGETIYTLSYIFNITPYTPAGNYTFNQVIDVTGTY